MKRARTDFGLVSPAERRQADLFFAELMGRRPSRRRPQRRVELPPLEPRESAVFEASDAEAQPDPPLPAGVPDIEHLHIARTCTDGKAWVSANAATKMSPSTMDPGFLTAAGQLQFDNKLDSSLIKLLVDDADYKKWLDPESIKKRWPSEKDIIRVCLIDLTGNKICRPGYAGWGSEWPMKGASAAKVAIVYAAYQIVFDLQQMATGITDVKALQTFADGNKWSKLRCKPKVDKLVTIDASGVSMAPGLKKSLDEIVFGHDGNRHANNTLLNIGFEYVASLLWQSGLRHPTAKGVWYPNSYQAPTDVRIDSSCHNSSDQIVYWKQDPMKDAPLGGIVLTARSAATFFTLLAQGRLVDSTASSSMTTLLARGCTLYGILGSTLSVRAAKCGVGMGYFHDTALIEQDGVRYVLVYLTKGLEATKLPEALRKRLLGDLHKLIVENNKP